MMGLRYITWLLVTLHLLLCVVALSQAQSSPLAQCCCTSTLILSSQTEASWLSTELSVSSRRGHKRKLPSAWTCVFLFPLKFNEYSSGSVEMFLLTCVWHFATTAVTEAEVCWGLERLLLLIILATSTHNFIYGTSIVAKLAQGL